MKIYWEKGGLHFWGRPVYPCDVISHSFPNCSHDFIRHTIYCLSQQPTQHLTRLFPHFILKNTFPFIVILKNTFPFIVILKNTLPFIVILKDTFPYIVIVKNTLPFIVILKNTFPCVVILKNTFPFIVILKDTFPYIVILKNTLPFIVILKKTFPFIVILKNTFLFCNSRSYLKIVNAYRRFPGQPLTKQVSPFIVYLTK